MKAIDRVMRAYCRTHVLTEEQQQQVRAELSEFIQELIMGQKPAVVKLRNKNAAS